MARMDCCFIQRFFFIFITLSLPVVLSSGGETKNNAAYKEMESVLKKLGESLFQFSNEITRFKEINENFAKNGGSIEDVNVEVLFNDTMSRINGNLQGRVESIEKLTISAEQLAFKYYSQLPPVHPVPNDKEAQLKMELELPTPDSFYNSKLLNRDVEKPKKKDGDDDEVEEATGYNCTKFPTSLPMIWNEHFGMNVHMNATSVHIPTSIYSCDPAVLHGLTWSSKLEEYFGSSYLLNPTLSWQYFGSTTGFLRQYPAIEWPLEDTDDPEKKPLDIYDCRFRPWYITSATSTKNIIILLDVSGSMTGMRRRIAKAVVNSILDTLTENDFVNVFEFKEHPQVLVACMNDTGVPILVQATTQNIRELRVALDQQKKMSEKAEPEEALAVAFETLIRSQDKNESANCNQAIMLVTDGAPDYFKSFFDNVNNNKKIRLFTYVVGREVTDTSELYWMACYNRGFFAHVVSLAEVQEKVFRYVTVMSRPLVISQKREVMWTPVYANKAELIESEWLWDERIQERQQVVSGRYKWYYKYIAKLNGDKRRTNKDSVIPFSMDAQKKGGKTDQFLLSLEKLKLFLEYGDPNITIRTVRRMQAEKERMLHILLESDDGHQDPLLPSSSSKVKPNISSQLLFERNRLFFKDFEPRRFRFVISASYPVYDIRKFTNSTDYTKERIANFLGVVGTDVSIDDLKELASPFELGVGAYAFAITNNGHIIFHPDFRPLYDNILKPTYNSLDVTEVELMNKDGLVRNDDPDLHNMRREMIDKNETNPTVSTGFSVRIHRDGFRRVSIRDQSYVFGKIPRTVYTLALRIPPNRTVYTGEVEVSLFWKDHSINIVGSFFDTNTMKPTKYLDQQGNLKSEDRYWSLHPDWTYCHYLTPNKLDFANNKEDVFVHFIKRIQGTPQNSSWAWGSTLGWGGREGDFYTCNKKLVQSVVFDARATKPFAETQDILKDPKMKTLVTSFRAELLNNSVLTTFVATRSGLTRWVEHPNNNEYPTDLSDLPFHQYHPRAIDESWYQRAVERAEIDEDSYIISIPFDAGTRNYSRVMLTRAVIATSRNGKKKAPVAVVGVEYDLDKFLTFLGLGAEQRSDSRNICSKNQTYQCFVLDENAFVIGSSEGTDDQGQHFGEVNRYAMDLLLNATIFTEVRVMDFQAVCHQRVSRSNFAHSLFTPFKQLSSILNWFLGYIMSLILHFNLQLPILPFTHGEADYDDGEEDNSGDGMPFVEHASIHKTKLRPCDYEYKLYMYGPAYVVDRSKITLLTGLNLKCDTCSNLLTVQRIPFTNLILVIIESGNDCRRCGYVAYRYRWRTSFGREKEYEMYPKYAENKTKLDPAMLQLCRTPRTPLYRKPLSHCHAYSDDESDMKEDCGRSSLLKGSGSMTFLVLVISITTSMKQI